MAQLGEGHEPGSRDAVREQPAVARVDHGIRAAVQDQRAGADTRFPQPADVPCSRCRLGWQHVGVRWAGALQLEEAGHEFWAVPDSVRRQGVFHVAAPRRRGRHAGGRDEHPYGGGRHGVGEGPARSRARQHETVNSLRVADRQLLGHHAAQARPQHVGLGDAGGVEHRDDIAGHVGDGERAGRSLCPTPRLSTSTSRKRRRSFRSTGSQPRRSRPIPWIRTSHGRRRCMAPRSS